EVQGGSFGKTGQCGSGYQHLAHLRKSINEGCKVRAAADSAAWYATSWVFRFRIAEARSISSVLALRASKLTESANRLSLADSTAAWRAPTVEWVARMFCRCASTCAMRAETLVPVRRSAAMA